METEQPSPIGALLLRSRKNAELTQEALAELAGVSINTVSNLEAGRGHVPRKATLDLLITALSSPLAPADRADLREAFREATAAGRMQQRQSAGGAQHEMPVPPALPAGTVTFLICALVPGAARPTDHGHPREEQSLFVHMATLLQQLVSPRAGWLVEPPDAPDGAVSVFTRPGDALAAACALQQRLHVTQDPSPLAADGRAPATLPVCLALHTGWAEPGTGDYAGPTRRRAVRLGQLGHEGQIVLSQQSREVVSSNLPEGIRLRDLGNHSLSAVERPQPVYQVLGPTLPESFPPLRPPRVPATNLPLQPTSFIGREREQAAIGDLLIRAPLVTLVGAGGCGKTRLALQVAADLAERYPDGIRFVELAALSETTLDGASLVSRAVATAMGLREEPGRPLLATLLDALKRQRLLLVLDNCEHLVTACATLVAALLRGCPHLHLLATSRQRLDIRGETIYRVPSLTLPDPDQHPGAAALAGYEAVRLFVDRACASQPVFALTDENGDAVARICARLDGVPLAIELAAARVRSMPAGAIAARLDKSIALLADGPRDVLPRHRTLRAALDWSWDLLSGQERTLLRRLSVFAGGWTLNAAEAVCGDDDPGGEGLSGTLWTILDGMADKSLLMSDETDTQTRYKLLETVRQYAEWHLTACGQELGATRDRHLHWCVALAEEAEPHLSGPEQGAWVAQLEREHDNLRAALGWAREQENGARALRLAGALCRFWQMRGYLGEGRSHLDAALAQEPATSVPSAARARALNGAGTLADSQGEYGRAAALHEEALEVHRILGDTRGTANALNGIGNAIQKQGDYGRAVTLHEEALALRRALGDTWSVAASLSNLAVSLHLQGGYERPVALLEEAVALKRDLGDTWGIAASLNNLGCAVASREEHRRAATLHEEALMLRRTLGDTMGIAVSLRNLGCAAEALGDHRRAAALHEEALALRRTVGDKLGIADSLHHLGVVAYRRSDHVRADALLAEAVQIGHAIGARDVVAESLEYLSWVGVALGLHERAARVSAAADTLRQALGICLKPADLAESERTLRSIRAALGKQALAAIVAEVRRLLPDQATLRALAAGPEASE